MSPVDAQSRKFLGTGRSKTLSLPCSKILHTQRVQRVSDPSQACGRMGTGQDETRRASPHGPNQATLEYCSLPACCVVNLGAPKHCRHFGQRNPNQPMPQQNSVSCSLLWSKPQPAHATAQFHPLQSALGHVRSSCRTDLISRDSTLTRFPGQPPLPWRPSCSNRPFQSAARA